MCEPVFIGGEGNEDIQRRQPANPCDLGVVDPVDIGGACLGALVVGVCQRGNVGFVACTACDRLTLVAVIAEGLSVGDDLVHRLLDLFGRGFRFLRASLVVGHRTTRIFSRWVRADRFLVRLHAV